jgi:hypothetical protein
MGRRQPRGHALVGLALLALLLSGCPQDNRRQAAGDPLIGGAAPVGAPKTAVAINTPLPPLPAAGGSTSPAALAVGSGGTMDPAHDLRIGPPPGGPNATLTGNPGQTGIGAGWQAQGNAPDAIPSTAPIAITAPLTVPRTPDSSRRDVTLTGGAAAPPTPAPPSPPSLTRVQSFEQAQAALRGRNVLWQDLKSQPDTGEWRFSCSVPNKHNPSLSRTYEGRATTALAAVQAVLDKIDADAAGS